MDVKGGNDRHRGELMNVDQIITTFLPSDNPANARFADTNGLDLLEIPTLQLARQGTLCILSR